MRDKQYVFRKIPDCMDRWPVPGDLVRNSRNTPDYINVVIDTSEPQRDAQGEYFVSVRSLRLYFIYNGTVTLKQSTQSRRFNFYLGKHTKYSYGPYAYEYFNRISGWEIVELFEYTKVDDSELRNKIVDKYRDVPTGYNGGKS